MDLFNDDMRRNPYPAYAQLRAHSPLLHVPGPDLWLVFDYDEVRRVLTDHATFSSNVAPARGFEFEWLLFVDPPRHTKLRALVGKAFTPRSIAELEPRVRAIAVDLLERALPRGAMDLVDDFATPLPLLVIAEMIGLPAEDLPRLRGWSESIINLASTIVGTPAAAQAASERFLAADQEMLAYFARLAAERRAAPRDDLVTRLALAEVDGEQLGEHELCRFLQLLLAAGTETTTNLISNAMLAFLEHPAELARVEADPALLPAAIEEVLRWRSPGQVMFRRTLRDVELHGQVVPAGKFVMAVIGSANRDPKVFPDPDRFDVGRSPNPHIAFGHGIHFCLGAPLSRLEGRVGLAELLGRAEGFAPAAAEPWPARQAFHIHGPRHLPIRFAPRARPLAIPA